MTAPDRPRHRRTGVIHPDYGGPRMLFAYTHPTGRLVTVIDAEDIDGAWLIVTGWGDAADIAHKKATGWRIWPCMVEWEERE